MGFKITIQETRSTPYKTTESVLAEERHYTDQEVSEGHRWMEDKERSQYMKKVYKDVVVDKVKTDSVEIYQQTVETLDMKAVIGAVNKS